MRILKSRDGTQEKSVNILKKVVGDDRKAREKLFATIGLGVGGTALAYMLGHNSGVTKNMKSSSNS